MGVGSVLFHSARHKMKWWGNERGREGDRRLVLEGGCLLSLLLSGPHNYHMLTHIETLEKWKINGRGVRAALFVVARRRPDASDPSYPSNPSAPLQRPIDS